MEVDFKITIDPEEFKNYAGAKINYSNAHTHNSTNFYTVGGFNIQNINLLFEEKINVQQIDCFEFNGIQAFFKIPGSDFPFDIFAATFYLLSRYEEYLPHEKDMYGRYAYENSLAYKEGFLKLPLINIWVKEFTKALQDQFPSSNILRKAFGPKFKFIPTYDIDIAYSYKHKGLLRNTGGFFKSPSIERIKVLAGLKSDPFDSFDWLHLLHRQYHLQPIYFFLVPEKNGRYDKNILPHKDVMWQLVKQHAKKYMVGLHPSWQSGDNKSLLKKEKQQLAAMIQAAESVPTLSRQHYIRFNLPEGYSRLTEAGITDDYSMGYGSINGFRASVASSHYWFNLEKGEQTDLRIHPFCFMDANAYYEQKQTVQQTLDEMIHYLSVCKKVSGTLVTVWHNNFLGTAVPFKGWKEMYVHFIAQALQ